MKKISLIFLMLIILFTLGACSEKSQSDIVKLIGEKMEKIDKYEVDAVMKIIEANKTHTFDVNVKYQSPDYFKVTLKNSDSNNVQIVLKNDEGVFVLTPALNKSFKFQSDWPLNSSQPYLFQSLVKDIMNDENVIFAKQDGTYVFETKVDYRRSKDLTTQKIIIDAKTMYPKEVIVYDVDHNEKINVLFNDVNYKPNFNESEFQVDYSMNSALSTFGEVLPTFDERNIMYPTLIFDGTELYQESIKDIDEGKRAIMTFDGTTPFTVIEQYMLNSDEMETQLVYGDPVLIASGIAFQTENTLTWYDNGVEFFVISDYLDADQIYTLANSFMTSTSK